MPTPQETMKYSLSDPQFHEIPSMDTKKEILGHIDSNFNKQSPDVQDEIINHANSLLGSTTSTEETGGKSNESRALQKGVNDMNKPDTSFYQKAKDIATQGLMAGESLAKDYYPSVANALTKTRELGIETGLGALGGLAGAATGPAAPYAIPVLSASGYALGKRINEIVRGEQKTLPESFIDTGKDIAWGTTINQAIDSATGGISKVLSERAKKIASNALFRQQADELGIKPTPADITDSKTLAQFETMLRRLYGSGELFHKEDIANTQKLIAQYKTAIAKETNPTTVEELGNLIKNQVDDYVGRINGLQGRFLNQARNTILKDLGSTDTYESLGQQLQKNISSESGIASDVATKLYNRVAELIPSQQVVDTPKTQTVAKKLLEEGQIDEKIINDLKKLAGEESNLTWNTLEKTRRLFRDTAIGENTAYQTQAAGTKGLIKQGGGDTAHVYSALKKAIEEDQSNYAKQVGGDVGQIFEQAKKASAYLKTTYGNKEIVELLKTKPFEIANKLFSANTGADVDAIKKAVGINNFNKTVKPLFTNKLLGIGKDEIFDPNYLRQQFSNLNQQLLAKIYNPMEIKSITDLAKNGLDFKNQKFYPDFMKNIAESSPQSAYGIASALFTNKGSWATDNLKRLYIISNDETRQALKHQITIELFTKQPLTAIDPMTIGMRNPELLAFSGKSFERNLIRMKPLLKIFQYSDEDISLLHKIANVSRGLSGAERLAGNPSGTGGAVVTQAQFGTALGFLLHGNFVSAGMTMAGPYLVAKAYLSEPGRKLLTEGLRIPAGSEQAAGWIAKMIAYRSREGDLFEENKRQQPLMVRQITEPQKNNAKSTIKLYQSGYSELQRRAKFGDKEARDHLSKRGLGWGN